MESIEKIKLFGPELILENKIYETSVTYSAGVIMTMIFTQEGFLPNISNLKYLQKIYSGEYMGEIWEEESKILNIESFSSKLPFKTIIQKA